MSSSKSRARNLPITRTINTSYFVSRPPFRPLQRRISRVKQRIRLKRPHSILCMAKEELPVAQGRAASRTGRQSKQLKLLAAALGATFVFVGYTHYSLSQSLSHSVPDFAQRVLRECAALTALPGMRLHLSRDMLQPSESYYSHQVHHPTSPRERNRIAMSLAPNQL